MALSYQWREQLLKSASRKVIDRLEYELEYRRMHVTGAWFDGVPTVRLGDYTVLAYVAGAWREVR